MENQVMINTRIPLDTREKFRKVCDKKQQTQAKVLRYLIENYIKENIGLLDKKEL